MMGIGEGNHPLSPFSFPTIVGLRLRGAISYRNIRYESVRRPFHSFLSWEHYASIAKTKTPPQPSSAGYARRVAAAGPWTHHHPGDNIPTRPIDAVFELL